MVKRTVCLNCIYLIVIWLYLWTVTTIWNLIKCILQYFLIVQSLLIPASLYRASVELLVLSHSNNYYNRTRGNLRKATQYVVRTMRKAGKTPINYQMPGLVGFDFVEDIILNDRRSLITPSFNPFLNRGNTITFQPGPIA